MYPFHIDFLGLHQHNPPLLTFRLTLQHLTFQELFLNHRLSPPRKYQNRPFFNNSLSHMTMTLLHMVDPLLLPRNLSFLLSLLEPNLLKDRVLILLRNLSIPPLQTLILIDIHLLLLILNTTHIPQ